MATRHHEQGSRLLTHDPDSREIDALLTDRQARGLSPGTAAFHRKKLTVWLRLLSSMGVSRVEDITPHHLRRCLLQLAVTHNPGGTHAMFRAVRSFLRWWEVETEPQQWGNEPATCERTVMTDGSGTGCGQGAKAWPVGSNSAGASPYGLLDMAGNVWEWCADQDENGRNDRVMLGHSCPVRVYGRCPFRLGYLPGTRYGSDGFRWRVSSMSSL